MSQAALQLAGAELEQPAAEFSASSVQAGPATVSVESEAARLAELAAAFALIGLPIDQVGDADFPIATADLAYRAYQVSPDAPANDWAMPTKAAPTRRGLHVDPALPVKAVQATDWIIVAAAAQFAALWGAGAGLLDLSIGHAAAFVLSAGALKAGLWLTDYYRFSPARIRPEPRSVRAICRRKHSNRLAGSRSKMPA